MPSITTEITLTLEVTVSCSFDASEPGALHASLEDFEIQEITGITPVIQIRKPYTPRGYQSSPELHLGAWNQFSPEIEAQILEQTEHLLRDVEAG